MFPGTTTKLSEQSVASTTSIDVQSDILNVSGTTAIATLVPHFGGGFSGVVFLVPSGAFTTVTTGNIALAATAVVGKVMVLVYSASADKWYPSYT
jgi:hypothetical protein